MTREIQLTQGKVALVDDCDYERVSNCKWHAQKDKANVWYALRKVRRGKGKQGALLMHRFIMDAPDGFEVDHRDGNGLNNTRENLRICSHIQNSHNRGMYSNNKSGYTGVCWNKGRQKWRAVIIFKGKKIHLGYFTDLQEAALTYDIAARAIFGEFARLNLTPVEASALIADLEEALREKAALSRMSAAS